jgi:ribosomal peptide maturation radical SAM protein 1
MASFAYHTLPSPGDALLVVPPFTFTDYPALGPHLLQACAREAGFAVGILYANLLLAAEIGEANYQVLCSAPLEELLGERFFAAAAYEVPPLGRRATTSKNRFRDGRPRESSLLDVQTIRRLEAGMGRWLDGLAARILQHDFKVVGCSTTFFQTAASVALLKRLKRRAPHVVTIIGGANCEGEMAEGILSLGAGIDFVFSGESEASFCRFLRDLRSGIRPARSVIRGEPCFNLDALSTPDFTTYYEQRDHLAQNGKLAGNRLNYLPYESSRGCWWGQKHHCTFCGLNGETMAFRAKSPGRVVDELKHLLSKHAASLVFMVDNIMPRSYFSDLLPVLEKELPGLHLFYEQKANLTLGQVVALKKAGVGQIQPGIEALSSALLKRMDKGVSASQNLALLRYARAVELQVNWNLLYDFPGDRLTEYEETLALLPLLHHLSPPVGFSALMIDRFSPYFKSPAKYGISDVRPWPGYAAILPDHADVAKIAYHFDGDYPSAAREHEEIIDRIQDEIREWCRCWTVEGARPTLSVTPLSRDQFLLLDSRGLSGTSEVTFLTRSQASLVLAGSRQAGLKEGAWALEQKLVVELDGRLVPLATAEPELIDEFEAELRSRTGEASGERRSLVVVPQSGSLSPAAVRAASLERPPEQGAPLA